MMLLDSSARVTGSDIALFPLVSYHITPAPDLGVIEEAAGPRFGFRDPLGLVTLSM
jgi:hypothetical protein